MAGYVVYWPGEQLARLKRAKDTGPIKVVFGSIHAKMPSIAAVKAGDVVYPVTLEKGTLYVLARLPVEWVEPALDYLVRETGDRHGALIPKGLAYEERWSNAAGKVLLVGDEVRYYERVDDLPVGIRRVEYMERRKELPHLAHQEPFNCCSRTAASGFGGSTIQRRAVAAEMLPELRFGPSPSKQQPLKRNAKGEITTASLSVCRRMSKETQAYFDSLFETGGQ